MVFSQTNKSCKKSQLLFRQHFFILLTHEGSRREVYQDFQPSYDIVRKSGAKGYLDHRFVRARTPSL